MTRLVFGPDHESGAQIEADKALRQERSCAKRRSPRPSTRNVHRRRIGEASTWKQPRNEPCVVKASGLAAGKGAIVCDTTGGGARRRSITIMVEREFGDAGNDGHHRREAHRPGGQRAGARGRADDLAARPLPGSQAGRRGRHRPEHRRHGRLLPDPGPRPAMRSAHRRTRDLRADRSMRCGATASSSAACSTPDSCSPRAGPKVLEFNCRFGDPGVPTPHGDDSRAICIEMLWATSCTAEYGWPGTLDESTIAFDPRSRLLRRPLLGVDIPGSYEKGKVHHRHRGCRGFERCNKPRGHRLPRGHHT